MATNVNISGTQSGFCSESDISINPKNPSEIICASNTPLNQGQYWSADGGGSWKQSVLQIISPDVNHTDPAVAWTTDGTAWAVVLGMQTTALVTRVYKSSDGGGTWNLESTPSGSQTNTDRETFWVDRSPISPFTDNMYIIWHNGGPCFVVARSGTGGSWGTPVQVSGSETKGSAVGADVKTNGNGDVLAFWPDTGSSAIYFAKSTNGGGSYSSPVKIASTFASFKIPIPAQDLREAAVYVSGGGYSGGGLNIVYACWTDLAGGSGCNSAGDAPGSNVSSPCKTRIWFSRSHNGGANWDPPVKVNDQNSLNDQFFPRLAVDDATGNLMLIYYDTISDPGRLRTDIWMQQSGDNGGSWSPAVKVTTAETDETQNGEDTGNQYGDYIGLASFNGIYFACWTDRRNGGFEQIWGAPFATPDMEILLDKSTFGEDEVQANSSYAPAYWLQISGFTNEALGFNAPSDLNLPPNPAPQISVAIDPGQNPSLTPGQISTIAANLPTVNTFGPAPILATDPTLTLELQAFLYPYTISFPNDNAFNALSQHQVAIITLTAKFTVGSVNLTKQANVELAKGEDPYFMDVNTKDPTAYPSWLSFDLRVFKVTPNQPHQMFSVANPTDKAGAVAYIQQVIDNLNTSGAITNGDTFDNALTQDEDLSALEFLPKDKNGDLTFNFAVARVRILANSSTTISPVRVFFRLFQAATTASNFAEVGTNEGAYRWGTNGTAGHKIAMLGVQTDQMGNLEYVTIPCFATQRVNLLGAANMNTQLDTPNARSITTITGQEVDTFFGCWLDVNQTDNVLIPTPPVAQSQWDGPWTATQSINGAIKISPHQCLIAEIRFDDTPIPTNATTATSDKLAQRNIAWIDGPNPGTDSSRVMPHPFDILSSPSAQTPDELMITWGRTPSTTKASIYLPAVESADIVALATRFYGAHRLTTVDAHTIHCPAEGVTLVPVPKGSGRYAGLLSVDLPPGVRRGDTFDIAVRQFTVASGISRTPPPPPRIAARAALVAGDGIRYSWRQLLGAFRYTITITTTEQLLYPEERLLAWLKWRISVMPHQSRWYPVLRRYLQLIEGRVSGFGGNPGAIPPSQTGNVTGEGPHSHPPGHRRHLHEFTGKVIGIFYDRFGDFDGFTVLNDEGDERWFRGREREVEELVRFAWEERVVISVFVKSHESEWPEAIVLRRPPIRP